MTLDPEDGRRDLPLLELMHAQVSDMTAPDEIVLDVNGRQERVAVDPGTPLLYVLRNELGLTAAKFGCGLEQCYACAVIVDGEVIPTCASAVETFMGKRITTLEGLASAEALDPVQEAFLAEHAAQCGYCTSAIILAA